MWLGTLATLATLGTLVGNIKNIGNIWPQVTVATCHVTLFCCCLARNAGSTYYYYTHYAPRLPEHDVYSTTIDHDVPTASLEHHEELDSEAAQAEPDHYTVIETSLIFRTMDVETGHMR